jgi:hypothetical protein
MILSIKLSISKRSLREDDDNLCSFKNLKIKKKNIKKKK